MTRRRTGPLLPLAALLALLPCSGLTQTPPPPPPPAAGVPGLTLSPAQKARYDTRNAQYIKDMTALQADTKMTPAQKQAKFLTIRAAVDKDMLAILTPAQRATVLKQRAHTQAQIKEGQGLADKLNASMNAEQKRRLGVLNAAEKAEMQKLSTDTALSTEAKRQKAVAFDVETQAKILAVLTPTQRPLFTRMMQIKKDMAAGR